MTASVPGRPDPRSGDPGRPKRPGPERGPRLLVDRRGQGLEAPEERLHVLGTEREALLLAVAAAAGDWGGVGAVEGPLGHLLRPLPQRRGASRLRGARLLAARRLVHE